MGIFGMILCAFVLNLDIAVVAFSLGTRVRRSDEIPIAALLLALFQSILPLLGFCLGRMADSLLEERGKYLGAFFLVITGYKILKDYLRHPQGKLSQQNLVLIFVGAGMEDLLTGISLGTVENRFILLILIFFIVSYLMNILSLKLGKSFRRYLNISTDALVGIILMTMGIYNFFS